MFGSLIINKITKLFKINNINFKICCKMAKKHDENKDIRLISRIAKVNFADKTIQAPKTAIIGNKSWGRIDYLTHYCGWTFIWNNDVYVNSKYIDNDDNKRKREIKKASKTHNLTDKRKRK